MSLKARLTKLEGHFAPDSRVTFTLVEPPPGLSRAEHDAWAAEQAKDGELVFTLDLGAASLARLHE
jgi:hypothetical protein